MSSGEIIEISQLIFSEEKIVKGMLFFRDKGEMSYQEIEMIYTGGKWIGNIPKHRVTTLGLEYVTILTTEEGGRIALPLIDDPFSNPLYIQVKPKEIAKKTTKDIILNPDELAKVSSNVGQGIISAFEKISKIAKWE